MRIGLAARKAVFCVFVVFLVFSLLHNSVVGEAGKGSTDGSEIVFIYQVRANESKYIDTSWSQYSQYPIVHVLTEKLSAQHYVIIRFFINSTTCFLYSKIINVSIVMNRSGYLSYLSGNVASLELNFSLGKGFLACASGNVSFIRSLFGSLVTNLSVIEVTSRVGHSYDFVVGEFSGLSGSLGTFLVRNGVYVNRSSFLVFLPYMSRAWGMRGPYLAGYSFFIGSESTSAGGLRLVVPIVINSSWPADWLGNMYIKGLGNLGLGRLIAGRSTIMGEYHYITARPDLVDMAFKSLYEKGDDFVKKEVLPNGTARIVYDPLGLFINESGIDAPDLGKVCQRGESGGIIWLDCRSVLRISGKDYATNVLPFPLTVSAAYDAVTHALIWSGPWDAVYGVSDEFASKVPKIDPMVYLSLIEGSLLPMNLSTALETVFSEALNESVDIRDSSLFFYYPGEGGYVIVPVIELGEVVGLGSIELSGSFSGGMLYYPPATVTVFIILSSALLAIAMFKLPKSVFMLALVLLIAAGLVGTELVAPSGGSLSNHRIILARDQSTGLFKGCGSVYLGGFGNITLVLSNPPSEPYNITVSVRRHDGVGKEFDVVSFQSVVLNLNASPGTYIVCVMARPVGHEGMSPPAAMLSAESFVGDSWRAWRWWGLGAVSAAALGLALIRVFGRRWLR